MERLLSGASLRIALINDNGFYAGAGIALARQARSFALAGHQVSVLALNGYPESVLARHRYGRWLSGRAAPTPFATRWCPMADCPPIAPVPRTPPNGSSINNRKPADWDLVILGNLHSCNISLRFLKPFCWMRAPHWCGLPMIWIYSGWLRLSPVPRLHAIPERVRRQRLPQIRRPIPHSLKRPDPSALSATQPDLPAPWDPTGHPQPLERTTTAGTVQQPTGVGDASGVDTEVFKPSNEPAALRESLGLDPHRFTVVVGADSLDRPGKGGGCFGNCCRSC